ncbi:MAG TPA: serine/threonine-protein kinase [Trebonia sp.]|nr:serine/threonine-protein kinase [Trebonia sp.]
MASQSILQPLRRWDPDRIGPYSIVGKLGAGAMGQVFLARTTAGRLVAVKTIRVELAEEPGYRARFAREVAAARRVSGVFTASVIEADPEADLPWVATAYVPAPSLRTLVRRSGPLPVPAVRWLAAGCAEALQSIHGAGLLHRDVKPANVLVAPDGPRVIDFGVARSAERVQLTLARGAAGTPSYMAPEQARDGTLASPASDIFSLGATLVYAATGHPPYRGETVMDILVRLATEAPDLEGLPGELEALVTACLQRIPRDRPTDSGILADLGPHDFHAVPGDSPYLPDSAMALIAEYQRGPVGPEHALGRRDATDSSDAPNSDTAGSETAGINTASGDDDDEPGSFATDGSGYSAASESTSGSHTPLPGFETPDAAAAASFLPQPEQARRPRGPGRLVARTGWAGVAVAALILLAAGTPLGIALDSVTKPAPDPATSTTSSTACTSPVLRKTPDLCVSQPFGDGHTVFVIHGNGFLPFTPVTISLVGVGNSRDRPLTDLQGTFNYAIDQGHMFFRGLIPPGTYSVLVTGSGGRKAAASFTVYPPAPPPPSGSPPPSGPPPSGSPPPGFPGGPPPSGQAAPSLSGVTDLGSTTSPPAGSTKRGRSASEGHRGKSHHAQ